MQQLTDGIQFYRRKAMVASQYDRFHPVLAYATLPLYMHMLGFVAIEADEEQSVRTRNSANRWHCVIIGVTTSENKWLWPLLREAHPKPVIKMADGNSLLLKALQRTPATGAKQVLTVTDYYFITRDQYSALEPADAAGNRISGEAIVVGGRDCYIRSDDRIVAVIEVMQWTPLAEAASNVSEW